MSDEFSTDVKVSVVVPVYNVKSYLQQCVDSVLSQTYYNLEIILVDDGSSDGSGEICDQYTEIDSRVKVLHKENGGLSSARNAGLSESTGEWISFVDSDDYIDEKMIQLLLEGCINNQVLLAATGFRTFEDTTNKTLLTYLPDKEEILSSNKFIELMTAHKGPKFFAWNKLYHKSLWNHYCFPEGRKWEDIAIIYKIADESKKVVMMRDVLYHYRQRKNSITQASSLYIYTDYEKSAKEFLDWSLSTHPELKDIASSFYCRSLLDIMYKATSYSNKKFYNLICDKLINCKKNITTSKYLPIKDKIKISLICHDLFYTLYRIYFKLTNRG